MLERCRVLKDSSPQKKHGFTIGGYSTVQYSTVQGCQYIFNNYSSSPNGL